MSKIKAILGEKTLQLIPDDLDKKLQDFFGIDSLHVVLGRNGSGKTHLLHSIARSFGPSEGPLSILTEDQIGVGRDISRRRQKKTHGVVFFTSLPYRRKINQTTNVLDVSPSPGQRDLIGDIDVFKKVCADLELNASLRGYIGYPSSIFSELFLPAVLAGFEKIRYRLSQQGEEALHFLCHSDLNKEEFDRPEYELRMAREHLIQDIRHFFKTNGSDLQLLAELATLHSITSHSKQSAQIVAAFLERSGFADRSLTRLALNEIVDYDGVLNGTLNYLYSKNLHRNVINEASFEIPSELEADHISKEKSAVRIGWNDLSSGMRALIEQFSQVRRGVEKLSMRGISNILILLDEGDAYLHLDWQRKYVQMLDRFLTALKSDINVKTIQVVLATHSPVIASDFPSWMITSLDEGVSPSKTFAAPIDEVILASFGSTSIGAFAAEKINELHSRLSNNGAEKTDYVLLNEIGDIMIRNALLRAEKKVSKNDN